MVGTVVQETPPKAHPTDPSPPCPQPDETPEKSISLYRRKHKKECSVKEEGI